MEIEQSSLFREIREIINSPAKPVRFRYAAHFHVGDQKFIALKVVSVDYIDDYENNYATEIMAEISLPLGTYTYQIYPAQDNLDITLFRFPINESGSSDNNDLPVQAERYTALLRDTGNPAIESNHHNEPTEKTLNLTGLATKEYQLISKSVEQLRMIEVGQTFRNVTPEDAVKSILTIESARIQVDDEFMPKGVDMVPAPTVKKRDHIIIPPRRLVTLPQYIHEHCGGIYSAGLGYYYLNNFWYLYPCYDPTRFKQATRTMTIINLPENKFPNVERTYRKDGDNCVVLATGEVRFQDDSNVMQLNQGNGTRFVDANNVMSGFAVTKDNKATIGRGGNNSEFIAVPRENGNNFVRSSDKAVTANPLLEYSKLAQREGAIFSFVWENADRSILFPGMMTKILYLKDGNIEELDGVLLKCHGFDHLDGVGATAERYQCRAVLSLFVKRPQ